MPTGFPDYYGGLTLPVTVAQGGTGATTVTVNALLLGAGTSHLVETNVGTAGQVLQVPAGGGAPKFQALDLSGGGLGGVLAISSGGTGTATPALVAGSNIVITGSWPANTIALSATPSITTLDLVPTATATGVKLHGNSTTPVSPAYILFDDTGTLRRGLLGLAESINDWITPSVTGDIVLNADTGSLRLGTNHIQAVLIDQSQVVTLAHALAVGSGGIGATTFKAAGLPQIVATVDQTAQTGSIGTTTLYAVPANGAGMYEISIDLETTTAGTGGTCTATVTNVTEAGVSSSKTTASISLNGLGSNLGTAVGGSPIVVYSQASQNITYATTVSGATGNPQYSARFRVKYLG